MTKINLRAALFHHREDTSLVGKTPELMFDNDFLNKAITVAETSERMGFELDALQKLGLAVLVANYRYYTGDEELEGSE